MIALLLFCIGAWWLWKKNYFLAGQFNRNALLIAFCVKVIGGCALLAIYTFYYPDSSKSDIHKYMNDAGVLVQHAYKDPVSYVKILFGVQQETANTKEVIAQLHYWEKPNTYGLWNENQVIIRLNSVLYFIGGGSLIWSTLVLVLISFCSQILLFRQVLRTNYGNQKLLYLLLFYSPTLLIWSSGLLKEAWLVIFLNVLLSALFMKGVARLLLIVSSCLVCLLLKPIVGVVLVLALLVHFLHTKLVYKRFVVSILVMCFTALIGLKINQELTAVVHPKDAVNQAVFDRESVSYHRHVLGNGWNILEKLKFYQMGRRVEAEREGAKSYIHIPKLDGTLLNFTWIFPCGIFTACCRPFLWESSSPFTVLASLENLVFLLFVYFWIRTRWKQPLHSDHIAIFCLVLFLVISAFIGSVIPVLGNLVRYKVIVYPAAVLLFSKIDIHLFPVRFQRLLK